MVGDNSSPTNNHRRPQRNGIESQTGTDICERYRERYVSTYVCLCRPQYQASAGCNGAFVDLTSVLPTWHKTVNGGRGAYGDGDNDNDDHAPVAVAAAEEEIERESERH